MLIEHEAVFFGGYAASLYSKYMPENRRRRVYKIPDFDVLAEHPDDVAQDIKSQLKAFGYTNIKIVRHPPLGEIIPEHFELAVDDETIAMLYRPISCHSYNKIAIGKKQVFIATIDTMLSLYLAFIYADKPYFNKDRILCMSMYLFDVEQQNRLNQHGLLKRFSLSCYGTQETLEHIRALKAEKFKELENKKTSEEYQQWFLKYNPASNKELVRETVKSLPKPKHTRRRKYSSSKTIELQTELVPTTAEDANPEEGSILLKNNRRRRSRKTRKMDYWARLWK
jgi:hypothetical protein